MCHTMITTNTNLPSSSCLTVQLMVLLLSSSTGLYLATELLDIVWLVLLFSDWLW